MYCTTRTRGHFFLQIFVLFAALLCVSKSEADAMSITSASKGIQGALEITMKVVEARLTKVQQLNPSQTLEATVCVGQSNAAPTLGDKKPMRVDWWYRTNELSYPDQFGSVKEWAAPSGIHITVATNADCMTQRTLESDNVAKTTYTYRVVVADEDVVRLVERHQPALLKHMMTSAWAAEGDGKVRYLVAISDRNQHDTTLLALGDRSGLLTAIGGAIFGM